MACRQPLVAIDETKVKKEPRSSGKSESEKAEQAGVAGDDKLILRNVNNPSDFFVLDKRISNTFKLGRSRSETRFTIDSEEVAEVHAHLMLAGLSWVIYKDPQLRPIYFLQVNQIEVKTTEVLKIGDEIRLGKSSAVLRYRLERYHARANLQEPSALNPNITIHPHGQMNAPAYVNSGTTTTTVSNRNTYNYNTNNSNKI